MRIALVHKINTKGIQVKSMIPSIVSHVDVPTLLSFLGLNEATPLGAQAHLKRSGKKSFDDDPGWTGIDQELKQIPRVSQKTLRAWLKEKRDNGVFINQLENDVPRPVVPVEPVGPPVANDRLGVHSPDLTNYFARRTVGLWLVKCVCCAFCSAFHTIAHKRTILCKDIYIYIKKLY